jgi:hypothetical protein
MKTNRNRRASAVGVLLTLVLIAGAGASTKPADASVTEKHTISDENDIRGAMDLSIETTPESQIISKDITPGGTAETFDLEVQNVGTFDANYAFYIENADTTVVPDVLLDTTKVRIQGLGGGGWSYTTTLRKAIDNATVSAWSQDEEKKVAPGAKKTFRVTIIPGNGAEVTPEDYGSFKMTFSTIFVGSMVTGDTSDLLRYSVANGEEVVNMGNGLKIYTIPAKDAVDISKGNIVVE